MSDADRSVRRSERLRSSLPGPSSLPTLPDLLVGTVAGACAFLVGIVVTALVESRHLRSPDRPVVEVFELGSGHLEADVGPSGPLPSLYEFAVWQYHSLHGVGFELGGVPIRQLTPQPAKPLVFVTSLLLLAGGWVVARRRAEEARQGAMRGALVGLGYLPLAVATALTATWDPPTGVHLVRRGTEGSVYPLSPIGVSTFDAAVLAGVCFPVAFGAVGGYLAVTRNVSPVSRDVIRRGGVVGAVAFAVGWTKTYVTAASAPPRSGLSIALSRVDSAGSETVVPAFLQPPPLVGTTWRYHGAHGAVVDFQYLDPVVDGVDGLWPRQPETLGTTVALLLLLAGATLVFAVGASSLRRSAVNGAAIVVGYFPLATLSALVAVWAPQVSPRIAFAVSFADAVTQTGLAYPVVFSGIGGVLAYSVNALAKFASRPSAILTGVNR